MNKKNLLGINDCKNLKNAFLSQKMAGSLSGPSTADRLIDCRYRRENSLRELTKATDELKAYGGN